MTHIGVPEKRIIEVEPEFEPVPGELPDFIIQPETVPAQPVEVPA